MSFYTESSVQRGFSGEKSASSSWRGDHTFSSSAAGFSLKYFIEPEVEMNNPHLSKKEIHALAVDKFEKRLRQDLSFEHKEASHIDTTVQWKIIEGKDGKKELATSYGEELITLSQLWDHTRAYAEHIGNPKAYNKEEEKAQLFMQDAFIKDKASGFLSVISHPDSVRFVQIWEKTPAGDIYSKQVDLYAATGRDFTHKEGEQLVRHITTFQKTLGDPTSSQDTSYAHVLLTRGVISVEDVRTIAVAHAETSHPQDIPIYHDLVSRIATKTLQDIKETVATLGTDFHRYIQKRLDLTTETFIPKKEEKKNDHSDQSLSGMKQHKLSHGEALIPINEDKEFVLKMEKPIEALLSEWVFDYTIVSYGVLHESFAHSALTLLSFEPVISLPSNFYEKKNTHIENIREENDNDHGDIQHTVAFVFLFLQKIFGETNDGGGIKLFDKNNDRDTIQHMSVEDRIIYIINILSFLSFESKGDDDTLSHSFVGSLLVEDTMDNAPLLLKKQDEYNIEKRAIFGLVIWMLFQDFDRHSKQTIITDFDVSVRTKRAEHISTTPWILLAIIWYLAQLKEVGMPQQTTPPPILFPLSGVIYIYIRDRIS